MFLKTYNSKSLMMLLAAFIFSLSLTLAQEKSGCCSSNKEGDGCSKTMQDSTEKVFKETSFENFEETVEVESIVRMGKIDLAAIDNNEDEKVYQDQMCWNVISDEAGECPQCGMILKEVTLEDAKKNLEENGFEVK